MITLNSEILQVLRVSCLSAPSSSSDWSVTRVRRLCWSRPPTLVAPPSWAGVCRTVALRSWAGVCRRQGPSSSEGWGTPDLAAGSCPGGWRAGPRGRWDAGQRRQAVRLLLSLPTRRVSTLESGRPAAPRASHWASVHEAESPLNSRSSCSEIAGRRTRFSHLTRLLLLIVPLGK